MLSLANAVARIIAASAERRAADLARRSAFVAGGLMFFLIGLGFLTSALWIVLAEWRGAMTASLVLGATFAGIGLILVAASRLRRTPAPSIAAQLDALRHGTEKTKDEALAIVAQSPRAALFGAFLVGLVVAMKLRGK